MESFRTGAAETNSKAADYSDAVSRRQKSEKKDDDDVSSATDVMSMFANILQNRINVQENSDRKSTDGQARKTNQAATPTDMKVQGEKKTDADGNANQRTAADKTSKQDKSDKSGEDATEKTQTPEVTAAAVTESASEMEADAEHSVKESAFLKEIAALLKQSGISDEKVNEILAQVKNMSSQKKENVTDNKDLADALKKYMSRDKELQKNSGVQKNDTHVPDKLTGSQEPATNEVGMNDMLLDAEKDKGSLAGRDSNTAGTLLQETKIAAGEDAGHESMNISAKTILSTVVDQRQNLTGSEKLPLSQTESTANLRPQDLIEQIVNSRQLLEKGEGRVKLTLNPPSLGTLDMDVRVRSNRVEVTVMADNKDVRQILQTHLDDLKNALQDRGLQMDRFNIQWQDGSQGRNFREYAGGSAFWGDNVGSDTGGRETATDEYPVLNRIRAEEGSGIISVFI